MGHDTGSLAGLEPKTVRDYDDVANAGLENAIPVAKIMTLLSESSEAVSMIVERKTQKTRPGRGPYPEMVARLRTDRSRTRTAGQRHTQKGQEADFPWPSCRCFVL